MERRHRGAMRPLVLVACLLGCCNEEGEGEVDRRRQRAAACEVVGGECALRRARAWASCPRSGGGDMSKVDSAVRQSPIGPCARPSAAATHHRRGRTEREHIGATAAEITRLLLPLLVSAVAATGGCCLLLSTEWTRTPTEKRARGRPPHPLAESEQREKTTQGDMSREEADASGCKRVERRLVGREDQEAQSPNSRASPGRC